MIDDGGLSWCVYASAAVGSGPWSRAGFDVAGLSSTSLAVDPEGTEERVAGQVESGDVESTERGTDAAVGRATASVDSLTGAELRALLQRFVEDRSAREKGLEKGEGEGGRERDRERERESQSKRGERERERGEGPGGSRRDQAEPGGTRQDQAGPGRTRQD